MGRTLAAATLLVLAVLVLGACAQPGEAPTAAPTEEAATPRDTEAGPRDTEPGRQTDEADRPVPDALAFQAPLVGGGTFDGAGHDGRDVALWFWAPW